MKTKKLLSMAIAVSMMLSTLPVMAQETEEKYTSFPMDIVEVSNFGRTYYVHSTNTGVGASWYGEKNDRAAISRDDFMAMEGIWKNDWSTASKNWVSGQGYKKDNVLTFNGIDYNIRVSYSQHDETDPGTNVLSSINTMSYTTSAPYYNTYDIEDGYYKGVSFLGGKNCLGSMPYVRYNYTDGTKSNWVQLGGRALIATPQEGDTYLRVQALGYDPTKATVSKTKTVTLDDGSTTEEPYYIYLYQINELSADPNKILDKIDINSRNAAIESGTSNEPTLNSYAYAYSALFVGMTLLSNDECVNSSKLVELKEALSKLPPIEELDGSNETIELIGQLEALTTEINVDLISNEEDLNSYYLAMDYLSYKQDLEDQYALIDYSAFVNSSRAYCTTSSNLSGNAYSGGGFWPEAFKAQDIWEKEWKEDMTENVLKLNDWRYSLKVVDDGNSLVTYTNGFNGTSAADAFMNIDVENGYYNGLSLLGGLEYNGSAMAVKLNYADGTTSGYITIDGVKKMSTANADATTSIQVSGWAVSNGARVDAVRYLNQYEVPVDGTKMLASIDIPKRNAVIENGVITGVASVNTYHSRWFGMGLKTNGILLKDTAAVSKTVSPDIFVNNERTYMADFNGSGFSTNYSINVSEFTAIDIWKNAWTEGVDYEDNIITMNGTEYTVRVDKTEKGAKKNSYTSQADTVVGYQTIDINDGFYTGISFLGGGDTAGGSKAGVRFEYEDGTKSVFIVQSVSSLITKKADAIEVAGYTADAEDATLYLSQYTFENPNPYKKVVSISIPHRNVTITDGVLTPMTSTGGSGAYTYYMRWLAMTMITNRVLENYEIKDDSTDPICVYVSTTGSDDNKGTETAPVKTIEKAFAIAKETDRISTNVRETIIILGDGEHEVLSSIEIKDLRGKVTVKPAEGANAVVKGSQTVMISEMTASDDYIPGTKSIALGDYGITALKGNSILTQNNSLGATYTFNVFSDGKILPVAEYPNNGEMVEVLVPGYETEGADIVINDVDNVIEYSNYPDMVIEGYLVEKYRTYQTTDFTVSGSTLTLNTLKARDDMKNLNRNWRIFNSPALLDVEGEWYVDQETMTLYYMPKADDEKIEISNMTGTMFVVSNNDVTFESIDFKYTAGSAISAENVSDLTIKDCGFDEIGRYGIYAKAVTDTTIENNVMNNIGYKAVVISGGSRETLTPSGNTVKYNKITRPGRIVRCYAHAVDVAGVGNEVMYNELSDSDSILIGFGGSLNKIMYNNITNAAQAADDLGAIYGGRNLTHLGNEIAYNNIELDADSYAEGKIRVGIYLDDGLSGTNIHHNVISNANRGVFTNGGSINKVNNNTFLNCEQGVVVGANPITGFKIDEKTLTEYAKDYFTANTVYAETFDNLDVLTVDVAEYAPKGNVASGNRFVNCTAGVEVPPTFGVTAECTAENNAVAGSVLEALAATDIDTNDIGFAKTGLDEEIAYAKVDTEAKTVTVSYVSTYDDYTVIVAVKGADGKLIAIEEVEDGEVVTLETAPASAELYVLNSLAGLVPITK